MASKKLVRLARAAVKATAKASSAQLAWVEAFKEEYGHDDISDALVQMIDYAAAGGDEDGSTIGVLQGSCRVSRVFKLLFSVLAAPSLG
jgi:hypothetical protein